MIGIAKIDQNLECRQLVDGMTECWIWTARTDQGYGRVWLHGSHRRVHRIAYVRLVRPIPAGLVLDHLCRQRACANPDHLEPVTVCENTARGRGWDHNRGKRRCPAGHLYSHKSDGRRLCRPCRTAAMARYRARRNADRLVITEGDRP